MTKHNLMVVKMTSGETVLTEIGHSIDGNYIFSNPLIMENIMINGQSATTSSSFLPGATQEAFAIKDIHVITSSPAGRLMCQFYGSSLLRLFIKQIVMDAVSSGTEEGGLDRHSRNQIILKHKEIAEKYGLVENEDDFDFNKAKDMITDNRTLH